MKNTVKVSALLFTSAFLLGACGQEKKEETTIATIQETTTTATPTTVTPTTATPTTATPTTVYSLEDAQKVVFEAASNSGTDTVTLYYKDDVLLKEEKVSTFIISKVAGDNPLEMLKKAAGETKEKLKVLIGKGVEYHTDYKDDVFTITYSYDYTKIDIQKLKEINPHIPLRDDNTRSYSQYRDALLDAKYVEK
jgi:hypothetical protein